MDSTTRRIRVAVLFMATMTLMFGVGEVVACTVALQETGYYGGAWYAGIACIISGSQGLRISSVAYYSRLHLKWISIAAVFSTIISVFGAAFDGAEYSFFNSLQACASVGNSSTACFLPSSTTPDGTHFSCDGSSAYYSSAVLCEFDAMQQGDTYDCSCVTSNTDGECYNFNGFRSCSYILNEFPEQLHASYALSMFCLFSSLLLAITAGQYCCFNDMDTTNLNDPLFRPPSVVMASAQYAQEPVIIITPIVQEYPTGHVVGIQQPGSTPGSTAVVSSIHSTTGLSQADPQPKLVQAQPVSYV